MNPKPMNMQTSICDTWQYKYCESVVHHEYTNLLALKGIDLVSKIQSMLQSEYRSIACMGIGIKNRN